MVNKKNNPEKGLRTVSIEFGGKTRVLKFGHTAIGDFEAEANQVLRQQKVVAEGNMIFADGLIPAWLSNSRILSLALRYALIDDLPDDIDAAIDSYISDGGTMVELVRQIITAYRYARDPSSVASLTRSWKISDDRQKFNDLAEIEGMEKMEKIIADAKARTTPGLTSTESESLS